MLFKGTPITVQKKPPTIPVCQTIEPVSDQMTDAVWAGFRSGTADQTANKSLALIKRMMALGLDYPSGRQATTALSPRN
jgi:hypothetical protein